eukprot:522892-Prymnesium_polylepis.1
MASHPATTHPATTHAAHSAPTHQSEPEPAQEMEMTELFRSRLNEYGMGDIAKDASAQRLWVPFVVTLASQPGVLLDCEGNFRVGVLAVWDIVYGVTNDGGNVVETIYLVAAVQAVNLSQVGDSTLDKQFPSAWAHVAVPPLWRHNIQAAPDLNGGYGHKVPLPHQYAMPQQYIPLVRSDGNGLKVLVAPVPKAGAVHAARVAPYAAATLLYDQYGFALNPGLVDLSRLFVSVRNGEKDANVSNPAYLKTNDPSVGHCPIKVVVLLYFGFLVSVSRHRASILRSSNASQTLYLKRAAAA